MAVVDSIVEGERGGGDLRLALGCMQEYNYYVYIRT